MTLAKYVEGKLQPSQIDYLKHIECFAPHWFWWERGNKKPQSPADGAGNVSDPRTAGTLDQALTAMSIKGGGGVGILVSAAAAGLVGLDIDNVVHAGEIDPLGLEAIERFKGAYVEASPSGTGLRIFCLGELPSGTPSGPTMVGQAHSGVAIKFEAYAAGGAGRFLRVTGQPLHCTAGLIAPCPAGIEWFAGVMKAAKANKAGPVNAQGSDNAGAMSLDQVFIALAGLRPAHAAVAVTSALTAVAGDKPRGKLSEALRGTLAPWGGDHSSADSFFCCEAIRRGAGNIDDVVAVWGKSGLGKRDKFKRLDYQLNTVKYAAQAVLTDLQGKIAKGGGGQAVPVTLPPGLAEALALSGDKLSHTRAGGVEATAGNVVLLLRNDPRLRGLLAFNELAQRAERLRSWRVFDRLGCDTPGQLSDDDITRVAMWLASEFRMKIDHKDLVRGLEAAALDAKFDPLGSRLLELGLQWDKVPRIDSWLVKYARIDNAECSEYVAAVSRMFLIGAVARALSPGCKMDTVLSLEGPGGVGKSTMFKALADAVSPGLFADGVQDASNPVAVVEGTDGAWILELGELAAIRRASDVEALKTSITRTVEKIRRPYAGLSAIVPRRFVMVATTNRTGGYLADPTGALARRFWPLRTLATETNQIDLAGLAEVGGQLWGEAVHLYQRGDKWHLSESDGQAFSQWVSGRELRKEDGAFHDELFDYLTHWAGEDPAGGRSLKDIAKAVGDVKTMESGGTGAAAMQLAGTLTSLGMEKRKSGTSRWFFTTTSANCFARLTEKAWREATPRRLLKVA